ncbi:hypothetical protein PRIPAC_89353 [Pristionchus pacificus]|uniref:G protein-coupled receptor n=1 Tax=Pristionchus pacificus TaxID=54126 RepID=A0A2A6B7F8_PRIPA|nr:hypothetical protein PRIPAC_89353 [Pristionchus pacificus]|eukprot:PDM61808.1 G protein-coupled receptor [Pristionchus pacificus]
MLAAQYQFMPTMLQGPAYDCSAHMPIGPEWAERYGVKQIPFGIYSIVFGLITEILYIPCTLGLRKDMKTSCFKSTLTNIYIGICCAYGLFMALFTRPVIVNSTHQSMFFSPMIPEHSMEEYVNWPHAVHNIVVACSSCLLYVSLSVVLAVKSRSVLADGTRTRVINNTPVFIQVMLICGANLVGTSIYVYMNFMPAPPAVIIAGQVAWQYIHGLPPFIYLALNKSIRQFALKSIGLGSMYETQRVTNISLTQGTR